MKQVRASVFETNSSSSHSVCICTKQEFEDFKNGKYGLDVANGTLDTNYYPDITIVDDKTTKVSRTGNLYTNLDNILDDEGICDSCLPWSIIRLSLDGSSEELECTITELPTGDIKIECSSEYII